MEDLLAGDEKEKLLTFKKLISCDICFRIYDKPIALQCGHVFCSQCVHLMTKSHGKCSLCDVKILPKGKHPLKLLENLVESFLRFESFINQTQEQGRQGGDGFNGQGSGDQSEAPEDASEVSSHDKIVGIADSPKALSNPLKEESDPLLMSEMGESNDTCPSSAYPAATSSPQIHSFVEDTYREKSPIPFNLLTQCSDHSDLEDVPAEAQGQMDTTRCSVSLDQGHPTTMTQHSQASHENVSQDSLGYVEDTYKVGADSYFDTILFGTSCSQGGLNKPSIEHSIHQLTSSGKKIPSVHPSQRLGRSSPSSSTSSDTSILNRARIEASQRTQSDSEDECAEEPIHNGLRRLPSESATTEDDEASEREGEADDEDWVEGYISQLSQSKTLHRLASQPSQLDAVTTESPSVAVLANKSQAASSLTASPVLNFPLQEMESDISSSSSSSSSVSELDSNRRKPGLHQFDLTSSNNEVMDKSAPLHDKDLTMPPKAQKVEQENFEAILSAPKSNNQNDPSLSTSSFSFSAMHPTNSQNEEDTQLSIAPWTPYEPSQTHLSQSSTCDVIEQKIQSKKRLIEAVLNDADKSWMTSDNQSFDVWDSSMLNDPVLGNSRRVSFLPETETKPPSLSQSMQSISNNNPSQAVLDPSEIDGSETVADESDHRFGCRKGEEDWDKTQTPIISKDMLDMPYESSTEDEFETQLLSSQEIQQVLTKSRDTLISSSNSSSTPKYCVLVNNLLPQSNEWVRKATSQGWIELATEPIKMPRPSTQSSPVLLCEETNSSDAVRRGFSDPDVRLTNDRSVIYAQCLCLGIPAISTEWLRDSLDQGQLLNLYYYEMDGTVVDSILGGPQRARTCDRDTEGKSTLLSRFRLCFFGVDIESSRVLHDGPEAKICVEDTHLPSTSLGRSSKDPELAYPNTQDIQASTFIWMARICGAKVYQNIPPLPCLRDYALERSFRSKFRSVCREASHPGRTAIPEPLRLSLALELPLDPEDSTKSSHSKTSNLVKLLSVSWLIDTICTHRLSTDSLDQHLIEATV